MDQSAGRESRSAFIERVLRSYFRRRARGELHAQDLERLDREAEWLNLEAEDVQEYQARRVSGPAPVWRGWERDE